MRKKSSQGLIIFGLISFILFTANYTQYQLSPLAPQLMDLMQIDAAAFTSAFTAPMIPAIFFSLISGLLVDRYGARPILGLAVTLMALGTVVRLFSDQYAVFFFAMFLSGFGPAFLNANAAKLFGAYYPLTRAHRVLGISFAFGCLGMTVGMGTTALLPSIRAAYLMAAGLSLLAVPAWWGLVEKAPVVKDHSDLSLTEGLKAVMAHRGIWATALALFFIMGGALLVNATMPTALASRGLSAVAAGGYSSMITVGAIVGSFMTPYIANWLKSLRRAIIVIVAVGILALALAWQLPTGLPLTAGLFLCGFTTSGVLPLLLAIPLSLQGIGVRLSGTAGGFIATFELLGAVVIPSHVILPLAGDHLTTAFIGASLCMVLTVVAIFFLPTLKTSP